MSEGEIATILLPRAWKSKRYIISTCKKEKNIENIVLEKLRFSGALFFFWSSSNKSKFFPIRQGETIHGS